MNEKVKEFSFTVQILEKGDEPKQWHTMKTVDDIFQKAYSLNDKERNKMLDQFKEMILLAVDLRELADEKSNEDSGIKMPHFKWSKT